MSLRNTANLARKIALRDGLSAEAAIHRAIDQVVEVGAISSAAELEIRKSVRNELLAYGQLQQYLDDPSIEEIWVNAPNQVHIARGGISEKTPTVLGANELEMIVERMLRPTGRRLDRSSPFVDASLPDGSRLHVVIPDITRSNWSLNIRKFPEAIITLGDLVSRGSIDPGQADYLVAAMASNKNILVSGATQAGKTTMLCALLNESSQGQRIITVEETFEIRVNKPDWVAMQTRQPNLEGVGEVTLRRLIKEALRMRPDRLVVGEVREVESLDLLIALNSGLPGLCTIHANSAADAISKLRTLPLLAGQNISSEFVDPTVGSCIDLVVHCTLDSSGHRKVSEIKSVHWNADASRIDFEAVS